MPKERVSARLRRQVRSRARGCCEYCRSQECFGAQSFAVEHVTARSRGGQTRLDNLAFACQGCNNHKYNREKARDPATGIQVPLFNPRKQRWTNHFTWSDDGTLVVGLTPVGRATVAVLQLNRDGLVNLRRLLTAAGEHPPQESWAVGE